MIFGKTIEKKVCFIVFNPKVPEFTKVIIKSKRSTKDRLKNRLKNRLK